MWTKKVLVSRSSCYVSACPTALVAHAASRFTQLGPWGSSPQPVVRWIPILEPLWSSQRELLANDQRLRAKLRLAAELLAIGAFLVLLLGNLGSLEFSWQRLLALGVVLVTVTVAAVKDGVTHYVSFVASEYLSAIVLVLIAVFPMARTPLFPSGAVQPDVHELLTVSGWFILSWTMMALWLLLETGRLRKRRLKRRHTVVLRISKTARDLALRRPLLIGLGILLVAWTAALVDSNQFARWQSGITAFLVVGVLTLVAMIVIYIIVQLLRRLTPSRCGHFKVFSDGKAPLVPGLAAGILTVMLSTSYLTLIWEHFVFMSENFGEIREFYFGDKYRRYR